MTSSPFLKWAQSQLTLSDDDVAQMKLAAVLDLFVSRIEAARVRGATAPLTTVSAKKAGGNSRATTRRMLDQLKFEPHQRRAIHRLMAGSPSGWPGLLWLFAHHRELEPAERRYARRQICTVLRTSSGHTDDHDAETSWSSSRTGWSGQCLRAGDHPDRYGEESRQPATP